MLSILKLNPSSTLKMMYQQAKIRFTSIEKLDLQKMDEGFGPVYEKSYSITFKSHRDDVLSAFKKVNNNFNLICPKWIAKVIDEKNPGFAVGQRFQIAIIGGLRAPVIVSRIGEQSFEFETLKGHPEAGHISFSIEDKGNSSWTFMVSSKARNSGQFFDFFYSDLKVMDAAQTTMWVQACHKFLDLLNSKATDPNADNSNTKVKYRNAISTTEDQNTESKIKNTGRKIKNTGSVAKNTESKTAKTGIKNLVGDALNGSGLGREYPDVVVLKRQDGAQWESHVF